MQISTADVLVLGASLSFSIVFVVVRTLTMRRSLEFELGDRMGPANWDFTTSWASTLTAVGALLGSILAAGVLPDETQRLSNAAFAGLNLFFGLLIPVAPLVYNATRGPKDTDAATGKQPQYQGYVWSFLLASAITLWAVLGELATIFLLLAEMQAEGSMSAPAILMFQSLLLIAVVFLIVYVWRTIYWTVRIQTSEKDRNAAKDRLYAQMQVSRLPGVLRLQPKDLDPRLPAWSVL